MNKQSLRRAFTLTLLVISAGAAGVFAQTPTLQVNSRQARTVIDRIRIEAINLQREVDRSRYDNGGTTNAEDRVSNQLTALSSSAVSLRSSLSGYSRNTDASTDLNSIFDHANRIDRVISRNSTSARVTSQWNTLKADINTLAGYYGTTATWNTGDYNNNNNGGWNNNNGNNNGGWTNSTWNDRVTGTYRLNVAASDNVSTVLDRAYSSYSVTDSNNQRQILERRLASPEVIVLQKVGRQVTMGSSNQAQVTFAADGVAHTETNPRGRQVTTRVTSTNNNLTIDYTGDRVNDFKVEFSTDRSGRLRVTRTIYLEGQNQTITAYSIYDRISQTADWTQARQGGNYGGYNNGNNNGNVAGGFYIPNNVSLTATLRNQISTRASQVGDQFSMEVTSPSNYRGAIINGHVSQAGNSGRVSGRANMQLDFDSISMNGRTYQFAGMIQSVSSLNGDTVTVNNEGTIRDNNQTTKTVTRAGIGAVLGAIIGAVAGGGSGAAIGAGVGAGAGAGSVLLGGRDNIDLGQGSTFTILSSAPANVSYNTRN